MSYVTVNNSPGCGTIYAVLEVAEGMPKIRRYSYDTRFENFSSFSTWTVKGLRKLSVGTSSIESPPIAHQNSSEWCMVLTKQSDGLHLSFLLRSLWPEKPLRALLKADEMVPSGDKREVFPSTWCSLSRGGLSQPKLIRSSSKNEDAITLQCEVCIQCTAHNRVNEENAAEPGTGAARALAKMFDEEIFTDFNLHVGDTVLKAHRALLSAQSPYFAAMLQPHTKEAQAGRVELSDVKLEVLKQVLLYVYKGVVPALKDMPWEILVAADKYQLQQLKGLCEAHLASSLNVDNAAEIAANAKVFSCDVLWGRAVRYIKQNLCQVMSSDGWRDIIATHPEAVQSISAMMA